MGLKIIPRQEAIPPFDPNAIEIKHINYYGLLGDEYTQDEITEEVIAKILEEIPDGIDIYLSLNPYGEDDSMEIVSNGSWLYLGYSSYDREEYYSCYNEEFADTVDLVEAGDYSNEDVYTSMDSGGQSPIPKLCAIQDMQLGVKAVEYFIRTGKLYPGIDWAKQTD